VSKQTLLDEIERDREKIVSFYQGFIRAKSPNPPGDTREAAAFICKFMEEEALPFKVVDPMREMPNIVGTYAMGSEGRHLVMNGHIDVFPVGDGHGWSHDPWGGTLADGRVYGRGACDMKAGTTASLFTYRFLHRHRRALKGQLTLTAVSDEETLGRWGSVYLLDHLPEVRGDSLLNGEPSGLYNIRFGEKGMYWLVVTVRTPGAHGAHTHHSASATKIASKIVGDLEAVIQLPVNAPANVKRALELAAPGMEKSMGKGGSKIISSVTLNIGQIHGGLKINMVPGECRIDVDIRIPVGVEKLDVQQEIERVLAKYPEATVEELNFHPASWCDPNGELLRIIKSNVKQLINVEPMPTVSLGGTDARLWRFRNIPAYVYGPPPMNMGSFDEYVEVDHLMHVVRTHVLSAFDYLSA
jgi:succinyl-diaminopimelate desuccinylase